MQHITSTRNPLVQEARALQLKSAREASGLFLCDGEHMVGEAIRFAPDDVRTVFVQEDRAESYGALLGGLTAAVCVVPEHVMAAISQVKTPQGIAATVRLPQPAAEDTLGKRLVMLENVQDPGNVGTILRTADAAGFDGCILTPGCADLYAPKTLRATMGSVFRMRVARVADAADAVLRLNDRGYGTLAAVLDGTDFYARERLPEKLCVIIGNEGAGITPETARAAAFRMRLPMRGGAESLNAAIAAAVMMYDIIGHQG